MGFGEVNSAFISDPQKKVSLPIIYKGILYFVELSATHYGNTLLSDMSAPALIDTGTSLIAAPIAPLVTLLKYLRSQTGSLYTCMGGALYCVECAGLDMSETLQFSFGDHTLALSYSDLFIRQGAYCSLLMSPIRSSMWILGDVFIRNYYVAIKYDEGVIDLYPKEQKQTAAFESVSVDESSGLSAYGLILVFLGTVILGMAGVMAWKRLTADQKRGTSRDSYELLIEETH